MPQMMLHKMAATARAVRNLKLIFAKQLCRITSQFRFYLKICLCYFHTTIQQIFTRPHQTASGFISVNIV